MQKRSFNPEIVYEDPNGPAPDEITHVSPSTDLANIKVHAHYREEGTDDVSKIVAELIASQTHSQLTEVAKVTFTPVEDANKLDKLISLTMKKIDYLANISAEQVLKQDEDFLNNLLEQQAMLQMAAGVNGKAVAAKPIKLVTKDPSLQLTPLERFKALIGIETALSGMLRTYSKMLESLLHRRRMLSGQIYGAQATQGAAVSRFTKSYKAVLTGDQLMKQLGMDRAATGKLLDTANDLEKIEPKFPKGPTSLLYKLADTPSDKPKTYRDVEEDPEIG